MAAPSLAAWALSHCAHNISGNAFICMCIGSIYWHERAGAERSRWPQSGHRLLTIKLSPGLTLEAGLCPRSTQPAAAPADPAPSGPAGAEGLGAWERPLHHEGLPCCPWSAARRTRLLSGRALPALQAGPFASCAWVVRFRGRERSCSLSFCFLSAVPLSPDEASKAQRRVTGSLSVGKRASIFKKVITLNPGSRWKAERLSRGSQTDWGLSPSSKPASWCRFHFSYDAVMSPTSGSLCTLFFPSPSSLPLSLPSFFLSFPSRPPSPHPSTHSSHKYLLDAPCGLSAGVTLVSKGDRPLPWGGSQGSEKRGVKPSQGQCMLQTVTRAAKQKLWTGLLLWCQQRNPSHLWFRRLAGKSPQVFLAREQHVQRPCGSCQELSGDWCCQSRGRWGE